MMIKNEFATALNILGLYDLVPTKVEVFNMNENKYEVISLLDDDEFVKNADIIEDDNLNHTLTDSELDDISLMLYVKDKFMIPAHVIVKSRLVFVCSSFQLFTSH